MPSKSPRSRAAAPLTLLDDIARVVSRRASRVVAPDSLLIHGDSLTVMQSLLDAYPSGLFDTIFADPPYMLSNDGISCRSGRMVSVNKGQWDRSRGHDTDYEFVRQWVGLCRDLLKDNGTMWVSGTHHVIFMVGHAMQAAGMRILNNITWEKPNPPPNLSCRYFTHSTELIVWAAKTRKSKHYYDYPAMRAANGGKQMKDVWRMTAPGRDEKGFGKHPTQKPLALLRRIVEASTPPGGTVLDPFAGSFTTSVAARELGRISLGIEQSARYVELGRKRVAATDQKAQPAQPRGSGKSSFSSGISPK